MKTEMKRWTQLGLGVALAGSVALASCGGSEPDQAVSSDAPASSESAMTDAPDDTTDADISAPTVTAEGGEGEGGVAVEQAATDPVVFRSALAITEAHILAARDAFAAGEISAAGEMFAHPVSEVLLDVGPYLDMHGVENFDQLLLDASAACFEDDTTAEDIAERTKEIIATLRAAAEKAPDDGSSEAHIQVSVAADQIDRAATMYGIAGDSDAYEPYLDGYGFYLAAQNAFRMEKAAIEEEYPEAAKAIRQAFKALGNAYPTAERPEPLPGNAAALTGAASAVILAIGD